MESRANTLSAQALGDVCEAQSAVPHTESTLKLCSRHK